MNVEAAMVNLVRTARLRLEQEGPKLERSAGDFARVSLPSHDCDVLRDLLMEDRARTVVEIGLAYGSSALAIAEALVSQTEVPGQHVVIDPYQDSFGTVGWNAMLDAGLESVTQLVSERSQLALPKLVSDGAIADAAFVDGSHHYHNVFVDLYFLREIVRPGGLVVLDDCDWASVATATRYFEINLNWNTIEIANPTRLRAYRLPQDRTEPSFEDFKSFWK